MTTTRLSLGPVLYYWTRQQLIDFYHEVAHSSIDIVYLGEIVCARRHEMTLEDWQAIAEKLTAAGKDVIFSSQVLLESESDIRRLKALLAAKIQIEANDMTAVNLLQKQGISSFVAGMTLNLYNEEALKLMANCGARRWVAPVELKREQLQTLASCIPEQIETEVFAFGRMPLAYSARCFTARHVNRQKDSCQFVCADYPDGLIVNTQEDEAFLTLNGIQTQSVKTCDLLADIPTLQQLGVDILRISPQSQHTIEIIELFHQVITGQLPANEAFHRADRLRLSRACNGYLHGQSGMDTVFHRSHETSSL